MNFQPEGILRYIAAASAKLKETNNKSAILRMVTHMVLRCTD